MIKSMKELLDVITPRRALFKKIRLTNNEFVDMSIQFTTSQKMPLISCTSTDAYKDETVEAEEPKNLMVEEAEKYPEILWLSGIVNNRRFIAGGCFRDIFMDRKDKI